MNKESVLLDFQVEESPISDKTWDIVSCYREEICR